MSSREHPTVLVVDDEENVAEAYALWLSDEYDVLTATSGQEAIDVVDDSVDVVLLDRRMPSVSGDEVLETIHDRGYDCRVAMVTAIDPDFDIVEMPFDAYLTKPVTQADLNETVERLLALARYDDQVRQHFALAQKYATLQDEKTRDERTDNDEFQALAEEMASLDAETDRAFKEIDEDLFETIMRDF